MLKASEVDRAQANFSYQYFVTYNFTHREEGIIGSENRKDLPTRCLPDVLGYNSHHLINHAYWVAITIKGGQEL